MCGARVFAGRNAGPLFHKKVTVEGADEDLSFNIAIPLPTPPPQQQPPQGIINKHVYIIIFFSIVAPPTTTDSVTTQQQQQQGILHGTCHIVITLTKLLLGCNKVVTALSHGCDNLATGILILHVYSIVMP